MIGEYWKIVGCFWALWGLIGLGVSGQTPDETDCKAMLVRAEARMQQFAQYQCSIRVKSTSVGSVPETGVFQYSKGRYHLDFHEDETICTGDSVMTWYKAFGEVLLQKWNPATDLSLAGILRLYEDHNAQWLPDEEDGIATIEWTPYDPQSVFYRKEIRILEHENRIIGYSIYSRGYGSFVYEILDEKTDGEVEESLFQIDHEKIAKIKSGEIAPVEHPPHEDDGDHEGHDH
jgi:hypothetical protein